MQEQEDKQETNKKKKDVGIFVFLGVMFLLTVGLIGFVLYITLGSPSGCNCSECSGYLSRFPYVVKRIL